MQTDRVVLEPGPPEEVETVQLLFRMFVIEGKSVDGVVPEIRFAPEPPVEGDGFELSV